MSLKHQILVVTPIATTITGQFLELLSAHIMCGCIVEGDQVSGSLRHSTRSWLLGFDNYKALTLAAIIEAMQEN